MEEARTFALQKQGSLGVALAVDRGYQSHGVDMSHNVLCGKDGLHIIVLASKAAAQMGCRFGNGEVVGGNARLRYDKVGSRWAALDLVIEALLQALRADDV